MKNNKKKLTLDRYVYDWVTTYLPKLRISSTATLRTYKRALNIFLEYLELSGVTELTPDNLSPGVVNNWMKWLVEKRGNSATTCNSRLAAIKSFAKYIGSCDNTLRSLYFDISDYVKPVKGQSCNFVRAGWGEKRHQRQGIHADSLQCSIEIGRNIISYN